MTDNFFFFFSFLLVGWATVTTLIGVILLVRSLMDNKRLVAWVIHDGHPQARACLVWANSEDQARSLVSTFDFDPSFLRAVRLPSADHLLGKRKEPGICAGDGSMHLYHVIRYGDTLDQ